MERYPGGKGNNIATMIGILGGEVIATGFLGRAASRFVQEHLHKKGVTTSFIHINDATRHNYYIIDDATDTRTLLDEEGPIIDEDEQRFFLDNYRRILKRASLVVLAGRLPRNVDRAIYRKLMEMAGELGVRIIINTREENMVDCMELNPYISMPDTRDTDKILGQKVESDAHRKDLACRILGKSPGASILTFDYKDFIVSTPQGCWEVIAPDVEVRSRLKVGDAMLAGVIYSLSRKPGLKDALRWGAAMSAVSSVYLGGFIESRREVEDYLDQVIIKEV